MKELESIVRWAKLIFFVSLPLGVLLSISGERDVMQFGALALQIASYAALWWIAGMVFNRILYLLVDIRDAVAGGHRGAHQELASAAEAKETK